MYRAHLFLAVSAAVGLWPATAGADVTTFSYTGGEQTYVVPAGVNGLAVTAIGAPGGEPVSGGLPAGRGAAVSGVVDVTPGQVLYVEVGGTGGSPAGGFNGGGDSGVRNGINVFGGGGASDVRTLPMSAGPISLPSRLIVAAGGGGSASPAAVGGDAGATGGSIPLFSGVGGGAGTLTAGGAGGCNALQAGCGMSGSLGNGGTGGSSGDGAQTREGAGGGGGLYGGGGGAGVLDGSVGGGGGGSSLVPSDLGAMSLASLTTQPVVQIAPVPSPTCQNVTSSTLYGRAVIVQLECTEFAGRALTYTIVGQPAHGRLSAITASGQVTYTPDAGFSGDDSFAYDASSTNGTATTTSASITVISPSVARVGHARRSKVGVKIPVTCIAYAVGPGSDCSVTVTMKVTEIFRAHKLVAVINAKSKRPKTTTKVVTVGRASLVVRGATTRVINIPLNAKGTELLAAHGKLPVSVVVTQTVNATTSVVSRQRLALRSRRAKHKKPR